MREIKFRAWNKEMETMDYPKAKYIEDGTIATNDQKEKAWEDYVVGEVYNIEEGEYHNIFMDKDNFIPMQYTGLKDKNGKEIYTGDILGYYTLERHVQQSHAEVSPEIDTNIIIEMIGAVEFCDCEYICNDTNIAYLGLNDIETVRKACGCLDDEMSDANGYDINDEILGTEVIGNIYQNPELLK